MENLNKKLLGQHIKNRRNEIGMTQAELAQKIGKSTSTVQKYENGLIEIPFSVLERIGEELKKDWMLLYPISVDELMAEVNEYKRITQDPAGSPQLDQAVTKLINDCGYSISYDEQRESILIEHDGDSTYIDENEYYFIVNELISYLKYLLKKETTI